MGSKITSMLVQTPPEKEDGQNQADLQTSQNDTTHRKTAGRQICNW